MSFPKVFDDRAFWFAVKAIFVVALLVGGARLASDFAFAHFYKDKEAKLIVEEARYRALLREEAREEAAREAYRREQHRISESRIIANQSVADVVRTKGKVIEADLSGMQLSLYENGGKVASYPILAKGKPGSYWETPTGEYEVLLKEESHFSSFGEVFMPYSMQFFGNFFIHGWPYYPDGREVGVGYSGGCIRLSSADAKKVYDFAERGTVVFVSNEETDSASSLVRVKNTSKPSISARAYLIADVESGKVYGEKNERTALPIASITKLMTAIVASETLNFERSVRVGGVWPEQTANDFGGIEEGEAFFVRDLMYPLLLESNNAVAHSLASAYGEKVFVDWMNKKAQAIGATRMSFADASGISPRNTATVEDLFTLMRYLSANRSFILSVTREKSGTAQSLDGDSYTFSNKNEFSDDVSYVGGKTGYTPAALQTMVSLFEVLVDGKKTTVAIVVLGSSDRAGDTKTLLDWFREVAVL